MFPRSRQSKIRWLQGFVTGAIVTGTAGAMIHVFLSVR